VLTATAAADTAADVRARFAVVGAQCWTADPVRAELELHVVRCTGTAGDVRSQTEIVRQLAAGGPLAKSRCTLVYCAFRTQADQARSWPHSEVVCWSFSTSVAGTDICARAWAGTGV
jgi:superfamily II DNA helicase RecQ